MTGLIKCIGKMRIFIVIMIHLGKTLKSLLAATFNLITVTLTSEYSAQVVPRSVCSASS